MAKRWSGEREAQHQAAFPPEAKRERNREAQARYRERNAKQLASARLVANILMRQDWTGDEIKHLADALGSRLTKDGWHELRRELNRRLR